MAVLIGSARIDENGNISGGKAGDQTGKECSTQDWYLHNKGWVVIRAKTASVREKIAQDMQYICDNNNVGYDQSQNTTLYQAARPYGFDVSKVKTPCETDCARAVRVCVLYAGVSCADFYTGSEVDALRATKQFDILTDSKYCNSSDYLIRGDILVTKTKGHTVVVLSNGSKVSTSQAANESGVMYAESKDKGLSGTYRTTESLNMRKGAGKQYGIVTVLPNGAKVRNYGYYTVHDGIKWLYVSYNGKVGFCSSKYLKRM